MTEYVAPYSAPPATISGGQSQPVALAIDGLNNLYVANYGNNTVTVYAPPYVSGSWTAIANGISLPLALALSPATNAGAAVFPSFGTVTFRLGHIHRATSVWPSYGLPRASRIHAPALGQTVLVGT